MKIERINIGQLIKEKVTDKGMSQAEFARKIGMARQNVSKLVFDKPSIDSNLLCIVSEVLECNLFDYFKSNNSDDKGRRIYTGNRGKTKQEFTFLLLQPAIDVLESYDGKLPLMSNVKYNECLKVIAVMCGINKPISSHWARHTGATLLLNAGINMEIVSKVLGHSSTKITREVYAKLLDETVADAMAKFEASL